jgi:hypothetical protein
MSSAGPQPTFGGSGGARERKPKPPTCYGGAGSVMWRIEGRVMSEPFDPHRSMTWPPIRADERDAIDALGNETVIRARAQNRRAILVVFGTDADDGKAIVAWYSSGIPHGHESCALRAAAIIAGDGIVESESEVFED